MAIPKIIFQTYKKRYTSLPEKAKQCAKKWQELNPTYEYRYFSDIDVYRFVEQYYGLDMLKLMKSFKVPVMKSDLWRILVIYEFGGIYSDIDTEPVEPLDNWIDLSKNFIVGIENGLHYTQWTFMAKRKSPIVKSILDVILERCENIDYSKKDFVHYYTANDAFTEGIRRYFDLPNLQHECHTMKTTFNCECKFLQDEAKKYYKNKKMIKEGFFCFSGKDWDAFRTKKIHHYFGSNFWQGSNYQSWLQNPLAMESRKYE
jgi:mannosyltransferase OCH1-like enzyme